MTHAQKKQKELADSKRTELSFSLGDLVLLNTKNIRLLTPGTNKLMPRWIGPFAVTQQVGKVSYKLDLPPNMKIHPVFHASLLKKYLTDGRHRPPPPPVDADDGLRFVIEEVLDHRSRKRNNKTTYQYLIKWQGYPPEHNTWEPACNLTPVSIQEYWQDVIATTGWDPRE
jgi:hypothetical protein